MSLNFIKAWRNEKWYNERVLIWRFTLVLIKINYGQIGDQTGLFYTTNPVFYTGQLVRWKPMFFRTELIFTGFVRRTGMFGNLCVNENINIWNIRKRITPDRTRTNWLIMRNRDILKSAWQDKLIHHKDIVHYIYR
jgi:hypothetical protein